jgi:dolichol-phosphate mannosyltransferase
VSRNLVVIPTYNEKGNIEPMLKRIFALGHHFHVLVVDDNSPDGTADLVRKLQHDFDGKLFLESRSGKQGLGTAYIHGFKWALARSYQYIYEIDADFSHNPDDLLRLEHACMHDGADVAIGSRYVTGVNVVNWPISRVLLSYFASVYVRFITRMPIMDATAGFICYRRQVLEKVRLDKIKFVGYAFQIEMKYTAWKHGFKLQEVPIIFTDRTVGESKMSKGIVKEAVFGVISMRLRTIFRTYKK